MKQSDWSDTINTCASRSCNSVSNGTGIYV